MTAGSNSTEVTSTGVATRLRNLLIVLVAIGLSVSVFFGLNSKSNAGSLAAMAESAMPLETALANGKPTLMEFYANWCTSCQAMAPDLYALKQEYDDRVNFVMLNVDNSKWLPEMLHYRVDGIPHFVFLSDQGESIASSVGEQPRSVVADNLEALIANAPLPHLQANGQTSQVEVPIESGGSADPRSHGAQVVTPQR